MTYNATERWKQRRRAPQPTPHHGASQIGRRNDSGGVMLEEASRAKDGHADAPEQLPLSRGRAGYGGAVSRNPEDEEFRGCIPRAPLFGSTA